MIFIRKIFSILIKVIIFVLPWELKKRALETFFGYKIGAKCRIGLSWIYPKELIMKDGSYIGNFNFVKGLDLISLGKNSRLGGYNWVTAHPKLCNRFFKKYVERQTTLVIGNESAVTRRHLLDCTDSIIIGDFTTIAGFGSQILTHSIDVKKCEQACHPIVIGDYCFIGTNVTILPGTIITNRVIVGAGSVIQTTLSEENSLYVGVPAKKIKSYGINEVSYFKRIIGAVE